MTSALNQTPCGLIIFNDDGKLTYINSALCALIGRARKKLIGRSVENLFSPKSQGFYKTYLLPLLKRGQEVNEVYVPLVDDQGQEIPMILSCNRQARPHGERNICMCTQVGTNSDTEQEIVRTKQELEAAQAEKRDLIARLGEAYSVLANQASEWEKLKEELGSLAYHDILTGLVNRRGFEIRLEEEYLTFAKYGTPFSILIVDVDEFKKINDTYGHAEGDIVLKSIADVLTDTVRKLDFVARWGGEEFVVLLPETGHEASILAAERIRAAVQNAHFGEVQTTVSIGVATCSHTEFTCPNLMIAADRALYVAKNGGRNGVRHVASIDIMVDRRKLG